MRRLLSAIIALLTIATISQAQVYYDNDPIGTIYKYQTGNQLMGTFTSTQKLLKVEGNQIILEVETSIPGQTAPSKYESILTIKEGKMIPERSSAIAQAKNTIAQSMGGDSNSPIDIKLDGDLGFTPIAIKVGDTFPPLNNVATIKVNGMDMKISTSVTRTEAVKEEEVVVPAGKFNTIVLEQEIKVVTEAMGMSQPVNTKQTYWIVPNKGVVKSTTTTMGQTITTELVEIQRP